MEKDKLIKMLIGFLPLLLLFLDPPEGMDPKAWGLFPFYAGAILMVMLRPVGEATALAIFLGLYAVIMRGHTVALSGFALTMTWLVVGAYIIAPVTPSNAARTGGIIYPIFLSVAESLGSYPDKNPRGFGAYISVLLYVVTMCTGITFLTGYAANTVAWALADQMLGLHITWLQWTTAFILPAGIVLLIAPYVMYLIYRPTLTKIDNVRIAREGLAVIGPMSSKEKILLCLFVLAIIGWATSSYTKINSTAVVLGFIAVCLMTNVLKWKDIAKNSQVWTTLMWYGGILGLAGAMNQFGFFKWMAEQLQLYVDFSSFSHAALLLTLVAAGSVCRYLFVSCGAYMASVLPVQFTIGLAAGLPAWDMFLVFLMCGVMGAILTHYANAAGPVLFGGGYVSVKTWWLIGLFFTLLSYIIFGLVGVPYWSMLGLFTSL